ncbi:hypothetical protein NG798_19755 [Ancylothrix sp. C2]|uniref:hypothetical protein n=1 Tax=Ancylothrix sp. D3o TaxID=2953691 RepID=UPI0021BABCF5|nr:hypothetical protein [Ancylothrix sp. D3o]MCT7952037.1 hypothetical protein [Ancylothrix sp. D3o]
MLLCCAAVVSVGVVDETAVSLRKSKQTPTASKIPKLFANLGKDLQIIENEIVGIWPYGIKAKQTKRPVNALHLSIVGTRT